MTPKGQGRGQGNRDWENQLKACQVEGKTVEANKKRIVLTLNTRQKRKPFQKFHFYLSGGSGHQTVCVWRLEDNLKELVLLPCTQAGKLGGKSLYLLSHFTCPNFYLF